MGGAKFISSCQDTVGSEFRSCFPCLNCKHPNIGFPPEVA
jgi:hypothetical protein